MPCTEFGLERMKLIDHSVGTLIVLLFPSFYRGPHLVRDFVLSCRIPFELTLASRAIQSPMFKLVYAECGHHSNDCSSKQPEKFLDSVISFCFSGFFILSYKAKVDSILF